MSMNVTTVTFDYSPSTSWDEWMDSIPLDQSDNIYLPQKIGLLRWPKKSLWQIQLKTQIKSKFNQIQLHEKSWHPNHF